MAHAMEADAERMAEIYYEAFQTDPGNTYWWPDDRAGMMEWMVRRIRRKTRDPSMRHFKVVDGTGEMVAFARWDVPRGSAALGGWPGSGEQVNGGGVEAGVPGPVGGEAEVNGDATAPLTGGTEAPKPSPADADLPRGVDVELCQGFFDGLVRMSSKWMTEDMLGKQRGAPRSIGAAVRTLTAARPLADRDVDKILQAGRREGADAAYASDRRRGRRQDLSRGNARWKAHLREAGLPRGRRPRVRPGRAYQGPPWRLQALHYDPGAGEAITAQQFHQPWPTMPGL